MTLNLESWKVMGHGGEGWDLLVGDSLEVLRAVPDASVDAVVTDPPAGIEFMGKEWDSFKQGRLKDYAKPPGGTLGRKKAPSSVLSERLDTGPPVASQRANRRCLTCGHYAYSGTPCRCEIPKWAIDNSTRATFIAAMTAIFAECLRVLKPGGHALVWALPRTSHWTATALEDAGFEVRDVVTHHFGTGFPKSLDVSKAIDRKRYDRKEVLLVTAWIRKKAEEADVSNSDIDAAFGFHGMAGHWTSNKSQPAVPTINQVPKLLDVLTVDEVPAEIQWLLWDLNGRKGQPGENWFKREKVGTKKAGIAVPGEKGRHTVGGSRSVEVDITISATDDARRWEGWGTALKPASEHWILARRPLVGTVAANVLEFGTGALNVDECRVTAEGRPKVVAPGTGKGGRTSYDVRSGYQDGKTNLGRWPANLLLSHSLACVESPFKPGPDCPACLGECDCTGSEPIFQRECSPGCPVAALDEQSGDRSSPWIGNPKGVGAKGGRMFGGSAQAVSDKIEHGDSGDSGGASRFFPRFRYAAKASKAERNRGLGDAKNVHPTVKPVALMRWLCRLVTPPGGLVLDPFVGSGTTGIAALAEGMRFLGVERSEEYARIAAARIRAAEPEDEGALG